jgi:hypothetical protein
MAPALPLSDPRLPRAEVEVWESVAERMEVREGRKEEEKDGKGKEYRVAV